MNNQTLYRSTNDRMVAGVCAGIAEHLNIDPVFVRVIMILLAASAGSGVLVYIVLWVLVPERPVERVTATEDEV